MYKEVLECAGLLESSLSSSYSCLCSLLPHTSLLLLYPLIMADPDIKHPHPERIHWVDDEEAATKARPPVNRGLSTESTGIRSIRSRRGSVDASAVLPIQYRAV